MKYKGVIFDFNGTLFWDTPIHNKAWDIFLKKHKIKLTDKEKRINIHGKGNTDIFNGIFKAKLSKAEIYKFTNEKEAIYRDLCLDGKMKLAKGSITLFEFLQENDIKFCIATSSGIENVGFFYSEFQLEKWFPIEHIIFHMNGMKGKPDPQIFKLALLAMDLPAEEVIIFEDSIWGIKAAEYAKVGKILIVNSNNEDYSAWNHEIISDFNTVDRKLFT